MCSRRTLHLPFQCCIIAVSYAKIIYRRMMYLFINIWHDCGASRLPYPEQHRHKDRPCLELSLNAWSNSLFGRQKSVYTPEYIATAVTGPLYFMSRTLLHIRTEIACLTQCRLVTCATIKTLGWKFDSSETVKQWTCSICYLWLVNCKLFKRGVLFLVLDSTSSSKNSSLLNTKGDMLRFNRLLRSTLIIMGLQNICAIS